MRPIFRRAAAVGIGVKDQRKDSQNSSSSTFDVTLKQLLKALPPIKIDIGSGVLRASDFNQTVIFVFGKFLYFLFKLIFRIELMLTQLKEFLIKNFINTRLY